MPYYFDALTVPAEDAHFWERLEEISSILRYELMNVHFETREEAINQVYRKSLDLDDMRVDSWNVARYRETDDRDNLRYFYELAREALGRVENALQQREMTAAFMHDWTVLVSCHRFVAAAMMARGDDLQSRRAGLRGGEAVSIAAQQQWFSHYFLRIYKRGQRPATEEAIESLVNEIVSGKRPVPEGFDVSWFRKMLREAEDVEDKGPYPLTMAFRDKKLSVAKMNELVGLPINELPPTDLKLHLP